MRGYLLHGSGDNQGAIESLDYSLSLKGDSTEAWLEKGECLLDLERFDEVRTCIQYLTDMDAHRSDVEVLSKDLEARLEAAKECPMCGKRAEDGLCPSCSADILLRDAKLSIDAGRQAQKDTTEAEELLHEAEDLFEKKFYGPTKKALKPMKDLLGDSWRPNAHALVILEEAEEIAMTLEADNMRGTMSIREKIEDVKRVIADDRPVKAVVEAEKALDHAKKIAKKYSDLLLKEPEKKKKVEIPADGSVCHNCGEEVETDWVKCPVCKVTLKEDPKAAAGPADVAPEPSKASPAPLDEGAVFCPKCGEEVETHWVRCLFCNTSLISKGGK
jgi:tetratricopeptide (TPR) repeat protein